MSERENGGLELTRREAIGITAGVALGTRAAPAAIAATQTAATGARFTPLYPHESATRRVRDLSGLWDFRLDPDGRGETLGWPNGFGDARRIPVPCSWNDLFDDARDYTGAAWYRTEFRSDIASLDRRLYLRFASPVYRPRVWLDRHYLADQVGAPL